MVKIMLKKVLVTIAFLVALAFGNQAQASLIQYELTLSATPISPSGGLVRFWWDDSNQLVSDLNWDLGTGLQGGVDDNLFDWSQMGLGGSVSQFLFEILTLTDVASAGCSEMGASCEVAFDAGELFGFANFFSFKVDDNNLLSFNFATNNNGTPASFLGEFTQATPANPVSAPAAVSLLLLVTGYLLARRR